MGTHFTKDHEWVTVDGSVATVGITKYAAEQLGDVVFVEFPDVGSMAVKGKNFAVVESTKTAADVYAPVSGEVIETNAELDGNWELLDQDAEGAAWIAKLRVKELGELEGLMDRAAYDAYLKGL